MSLSDKEKIIEYEGIDGVDGMLVYYSTADIKEAVKELKKWVNNVRSGVYQNTMNGIIDEIFGEELT
jgi:hypothetical protein